jgi:unsaturated rhamnogalacturonyl hydrolase
MNRISTAVTAAWLSLLAWPLSGPGSSAAPQAEPVVLLDCYYNNEWRQDSSGASLRYHYVWHDTTNSGYSQLAAIIRRRGAAVDTLSERPTRAALERAAVYIIVDPDTPRETQALHVPDEGAAADIAAWVGDGGVLLLMGNDAGNADLGHLNVIAERYGIRFNQDCRNRVQGSTYETGTFDSLPAHPVFDGARRIFLKEVCTLSLSPPAEPLLVDGPDVIMAVSRFGRGTVVAVGDPWLYNEYMDARRLPEGYDNAKAADGLFAWLLSLNSRHR